MAEESPRRASLNGVHLDINSPASTPGGPSKMSSDVATLQRQVATLQAELAASNGRLQMWEDCMRQLANSVLLSPEMTDMYKTTCVELIHEALSSVESVQRVVYADCSFPSVAAEAPRLSLLKWDSMDYSEWSVSWKPSWTVQVALEGSHYIAFQLLLKISEVELSGRLKLSINSDPAFSKIAMSFLGAPKMSLKSACTVNWGATPLPIQEYITSAIDDFFKTYVRDTMVAPNAYTLEPPSFQPKKGLTDEDVERAVRAVEIARSLSAAQEGF